MPTLLPSLGWCKRLAALTALVLLGYLGVAYLALPAAWKHHTRRHVTLEKVPRITLTGDGIPGDPLNVAFVGTEAELKTLMLAGKWSAADPLGWRSSLGIATATIFKRNYVDAPVSNLYLWGRKEDLAFEQPVGDNPRQRHHVRFWRSNEVDDDGRPFWIGAATYDLKVGFSHTTGQITHHIAPDVDGERAHLFRTLEQTGLLFEVYFEDGFHQQREGRNGGGDRWQTDGRLEVGVIANDNTPRDGRLPSS